MSKERETAMVPLEGVKWAKPTSGPMKGKAPTKSLVSIDDVGVATAFLAHDAARLITGETLYIDGGYHIMD